MALGLVDWVALVFWVAVIFISFAVSAVLFKKFLKDEKKVRVRLAYCLVFLSLGIGRLLLVYFDYFLTELNPALYENFQLMWKLATLAEVLGLGFLILASEYAVFKGKDYYIITIGFSVVVCIGLVIQDFFLSQNIFVYAIAFAAIIPIIWLYLAIKLPETRKDTFLIFLGFIIFGAGLILLSAGIVELLTPLLDIHALYLISAIIQIPGLLILAPGIKRMYFTN